MSSDPPKKTPQSHANAVQTNDSQAACPNQPGLRQPPFGTPPTIRHALRMLKKKTPSGISRQPSAVKPFMVTRTCKA
jgi:hypothetical protein